MKKVVITAFDITTAKRAGETHLAIPKNALVTPQAADDARDYGIDLVRDTSAPATPEPAQKQAASPESLAAEIRRRVVARLGGAVPVSLDAVITDVLAIGTKAAHAHDESGVVCVSAGTAPVRQGASPGGVAMVEAVPPSPVNPGVAYMAWENTSFSWAFPRAELLVVLEGEITVTAKGSARTGKPGDTFIIPAGTEATLAATGKVRCMHSSWDNPGLSACNTGLKP